MMLEEFLTLSEVKDGLTTLTRVEELISLMQKEKACDVKSVVEATEHHCAIARAIAETKNTDCLDHFIELGGLWYINGWLNDALKSAADTSGDFIEESIALQCRALGKLGIDNENLISSGILDTVKNLSDHSSTIIKKKAQELLDSWKDVDLTIVPKGVEKVDAIGDTKSDEDMPKANEDGTLLEAPGVQPVQTETRQHFGEATKEEVPDVKDSDCSQLVEVEDTKIEATDSKMITPVSLDQIDLDEGAISVISDTVGVIHEAVGCIVAPTKGIINFDNSNSLDLREDVGDEKLGTQENTDNVKVTEKIDSTSAGMETVNVTQISRPQESEGCSSTPGILMAEQATPELKTQADMDCKEGTVLVEYGLVYDAKNVPSENGSGLDDFGLQKCMGRGSPERSSPRLEGLTAITEAYVDVGLNNRSDEDYSKGSAIQNLARDTKSSAVADMRSDIELDYGVMDALEVARQVAKAVEREMNDGSSENESEASRQPGSPDSINEIDSQSENLSDESSSKLDLSPEPSAEREVESSSSEKIDNEPEKCMRGVDHPQASAQEVQINTNKDICKFDLNQEVPLENVEFSVNFGQNTGEENGVNPTANPTTIPAPVVSGSRSPVDASQFGRSHGWKGSAAISVFHQLSPHRDEHPGHALPCVPSGIGGKPKQGVLSIDLNVDKEGHDSNAVLLSEKDTMPRLNNMWGGPSVAAAPTKRLDFDLNMMSDVDDTPSSSSWRLDKQHFSNFNGHLSSSPASSSSSIQPRINIDLNEGPAMQSMSSRLHPFFCMPSSQHVEVHQDAKPVISIMGARVEVNRNDFSLGAPSVPNGTIENHAMEANVGVMGSYLGVGPLGSYGHPSHFGYGNMNTGPPTMSFMSPMFRPGNTMTYMVDPRVGPVPQMVSSSSVVPHMYTQPPFFMSMAGPPPGLNEVLPSRPNADLNLGFMTDGGNRQDVASRQLFSNNQVRFIGEQLNPPDSRPTSSFGKRKEPETGWETFPYNMKHHYPPGNR
ncbi:hypothetical protein QQ045_030272 [Rhodiola kirilowii]